MTYTDDLKTLLASKRAQSGDPEAVKEYREAFKSDLGGYRGWTNPDRFIYEIDILLQRNAELEESVRVWRSALLDAWANDHRATMTALLEMGPATITAHCMGTEFPKREK